jgi:DNA-binding Xre family transcriptional regulator
LSRISNKVGYSTSTNVLGLLCEYFDCEVGDIAERVKNEQP